MGKNSRSFETEVELEGNPVAVTVEYSYSPGSPGKTYGPPEDCYPEEGAEAEVEVVYLTADKAKTDIMPKLTTEAIENLFEQSCTEGEDSEEAAYEDAMERKADEQRERDWDR